MIAAIPCRAIPVNPTHRFLPRRHHLRKALERVRMFPHKTSLWGVIETLRIVPRRFDWSSGRPPSSPLPNATPISQLAQRFADARQRDGDGPLRLRSESGTLLCRVM